jgi:hypothetical protein
MDRDRRRMGDFYVSERALEEAREAFQERSPRSRKGDKALRGPIASDFETWEENQRAMDFPGIDTPTQHPDHGAMDQPLPSGGRSREQEMADVILAPEDQDFSARDDVRESFRWWQEQSGAFTDAFFGTSDR